MEQSKHLSEGSDSGFRLEGWDDAKHVDVDSHSTGSHRASCHLESTGQIKLRLTEI